MADDPSPKTEEGAADGQSGMPEPQALQPKTEAGAEKTDAQVADGKSAEERAEAARATLRARRGTYRPSHKATFIGLAIVVLILAINGGVIFFIIKKQTGGEDGANKGQVTVSQEALEQLGVNRGSAGNSGIELTINPDTKFTGSVQVGGDITIAGQFQLNSKLNANDASIANLQAGTLAVNTLNVNGAVTMNSLALRTDLTTNGATRLQGPVTVANLLTVANINVANALSVGGTLTVRNFQSSQLTVDSDLIVGGRIVVRGSAPTVVGGSGLGSNGTVAISGSDAAGTISIATGVGAGNGTFATVTFRRAYATTPHVVVSAIGAGISDYYIASRSTTGFTVGVSGAVPPGGYAFDYIVMQ